MTKMKRYICLLLALCSVLAAFGCSKPDGTQPTESYKEAVASFCNFLIYDIKDIRGFAPADFWDYMKNEEGFDIESDEAKANVALYIEKNREITVSDYGENVKISHKITEEKELNQPSIDAKLEFIGETYGIDRGRILEVKRVTVEFTIKGEGGELKNTIDILPVNIDGKWYPCTTKGYFYVHPYAGAAMAY